MLNIRKLVVAAVVALAAFSAMASNFRAADQIYLPGAISASGASGTFFSDVYVSNLTDDPVTVSVIFSAGQAGAIENFPNLFTLNPRERREFINWVNLPTSQGGLGKSNAFGQAVFNGCRQGADCGPATQDPNTGISPNFRDISVESRVYSIPPGTTLASNPPTTGQLFTGIPWYHFVSQDQTATGLDKVFITGIVATGGAGTAGTSRSNIGLVNASQFSSTDLVVKLFNGATGTQVGSDFRMRLGPLGHAQPGLTTMFPGASGRNLYVTVEQQNTTVEASTNPPAGCSPPASNGCPAFLAYGSVLDNLSGDATTL
ncbi:MAG TPA: hypothetical protein VNL91_02980, partial [Thermoanaerobaculia bacterium]|nr:hypothetical protein [Thermoanaerobaculia bacterium]